MTLREVVHRTDTLTPYAKRKVFDGPKASDGTDKASKRPAFDLVGREAETG